MFKLLNRFAWILSFGIALNFSLFVDRDGPFDDFGFWVFLITFGIIKFLILSNGFIESRIKFFIEQIGIQKITNTIKPLNIQKDEKIEKIEEDEDILELTENESYLEKDEELDIKTNLNQEKIIQKEIENEKVKEDSKVAIYINEFFSENLLAKIGSILVFLGVLFLMSLIWNQIPSVMKIIIGFIIGFGIYFAGVILDQKGYTGESKILIGAGILINYLVILAGKYLIGDNYGSGGEGILGTGLTFLFLILNTLFAIVTSFVYKSRTLLIFSFIFAYLNPLLIGGDSTTPYLLSGYSIIVSIGAMYIGYLNNDNILKLSAFVLGNLLLLIAPFDNDIGWITKMLCTGFLGFITLITYYKNRINKTGSENILNYVFVLNYLFIILQLSLGGSSSILGSAISYITYMLSILLFFGIGIFFIITQAMTGVLSMFILPILIVVGLIVTGSIHFVTLSMGLVVFVYLLGFSFLVSRVSSAIVYLFFVILGFFIFFVNGFIGFNILFNNNLIDFPSFLTTVIVSFVFIFTSYIFSKKEGLEYLYSIGTIGGILTLLPVLAYKPINPQVIVSIISVGLFALSNQILPFINKNLVEKSINIKNLVIGSIFGVIFLSFELFIYGDIYFPGVSLGIAFCALAILYFVLGYLMMNKLGFDQVKNEVAPKNTIYSYMFISISIFSLAIALVFSNHTEIISTVWLFEASILFYFFNKTKESKIYIVSLILFIIGIFNLFTLLDVVRSKEYLFLVSFTFIGFSLVYNLVNLNFIESGIKRVSHDLLHIIGIGVLTGLLVKIIPNTGHGWSILGISIFVFIIGNIYAYFNSKILKTFFLIIFGGFMYLHISESSYITRNIDRDLLGSLRILQYASTFILGITILYWKKLNKISIYNNVINLFYAIYLIFILSFYVDDIFNTTFAVTIFWGIISSLYLFYGINIDKIKYRTIGLYILSGVLVKIFINDLWLGNINAATRVLALIGIGILLIIISTRYTKKYGNNLKGEFSMDNLTEKENNKSDNIQNELKNENSEESFNNKMENTVENININDKNIKEKVKNENIEIKKFIINKKIENIDVTNIKYIEFIFSGKSMKIRAINLIKIVKLIIDHNSGKTKFKAKELVNTYKYIKDNFKSELSRENYNKIVEIMDEFVNVGGEVNIIEK